MRSALKSSARRRQARRSISETRRTAFTASSTERTRKPESSVRISRGEPRSMAMTGVPQASDSTMVSPKRSGRVTRCKVAQAFLSSSSRSRGPTGPMKRICSSSRWGAISRSKYSASWMMPAMISRRPVRRATSMARCTPFSGWMRPRKTSVSPACGLKVNCLRSMPL